MWSKTIRKFLPVLTYKTPHISMNHYKLMMWNNCNFSWKFVTPQFKKRKKRKKPTRSSLWWTSRWVFHICLTGSSHILTNTVHPSHTKQQQSPADVAAGPRSISTESRGTAVRSPLTGSRPTLFHFARRGWGKTQGTTDRSVWPQYLKNYQNHAGC